MLTTLDEIADGIYRISTFVPEVGPDGFTFNQFLVDAEEPLLYHTGMKGLFPLVSREVARVRPLEQLRWIAFAHVEADECGAIEQFLAAAPNAQVAHGATGCMVSLNDMLSSPPRPLVDGETVDLGGKEVRTRRVSPRRTCPTTGSRRSCSRRPRARCCAATCFPRQAIRRPSPPTTW
jgi:flavorubredoxin